MVVGFRVVVMGGGTRDGWVAGRMGGPISAKGGGDSVLAAAAAAASSSGPVTSILVP